MCIAAYLALFTGAGAATDLAAGLRPGLMAIFAVSLAWLTGRWVARRVRARWRERAAPGAG